VPNYAWPSTFAKTCRDHRDRCHVPSTIGQA
jgi:hypothetical protein